MKNYLIYYMRSIHYEIKDVNIKCMRLFLYCIEDFCFYFYYKSIKNKKRRREEKIHTSSNEMK